MSASTNVASRLAEADQILLILDFDGTLSPIVDCPSEAILPEETRQCLLRLSQFSCIHICVMSGRSLCDLQRRVAIPGLIYVGNHGLEAEGIYYDIPGLDREKIPKMMQDFVGVAERSLQGINGIILDNKGLTVSVHYRMVAEEQVASVRSIVESIIQNFPRLHLTYGKKVLEVRSDVKWDKGTMARLLYELMRISHPDSSVLPVYIGDDTTDEDAFYSLSGPGLTIRVCEEKVCTKAKFCVKDTGEVLSLLQELEALLSNRSEKEDLIRSMDDWHSLQDNS